MSKLSLLELLKSKYSIQAPRIVRKCGMWGDSVRWMIESGDRNLFLKEKPYYLQFDEFVQVLDYQKFLMNNGVKTARLQKTAEEKTYFFWNGRVFALHEWINGRFLLPNVENDLRELGILAGKIAKQTMKIDGEKLISPVCSEVNFPKITNSSFQNYINILSNYFESKDGLNNHVASCLSDMEHLLKEIQGNVDWTQLTCSWIHGDLHYYNVICEYKSNIPIPIDLDDAHWNYSLIDIAWQCILVGAWSWPNIDNRLMLKQEIDLDKMYVVFDGYMEKAPLNSKDLTAYKYFLSVILVYSIICINELNEHFNNTNVNYNTIRVVHDMIEKINISLVV